MKYYAQCLDANGAEVSLAVKGDNQEEAIGKLHKLYKLTAVLSVSEESPFRSRPVGYWASTSHVVKASAPHPGRVRGRTVSN